MTNEKRKQIDTNTNQVDSRQNHRQSNAISYDTPIARDHTIISPNIQRPSIPNSRIHADHRPTIAHNADHQPSIASSSNHANSSSYKRCSFSSIQRQSNISKSMMMGSERRPFDNETKKYNYMDSIHPLDEHKPLQIENADSPQSQLSRESHLSRESRLSRFKKTRFAQWIKRQCTNTDNRYALQMAVAFTLAAIPVMVSHVANVFPNAFWIGVSVVTVLDTTVGGFLSLSIQRFFGTLVGGTASIIVITITRAIFHPNWDWPAAVVLGTLMFIQIFFIAKLKLRPNMAYTGSIGLLTTCIILLSGYPDLITDRLSLAAELGAWRALDLVLGILISLFVSLVVFPVKASSMLRRNLGKSIQDAADLYEKSAANHFRYNPSEKKSREQEKTFSERVSDVLSTHPPESMASDVQETAKFWNQQDATNEALSVLAKLQTESTRLRNVATEGQVQTLFHFFHQGGKAQCEKDLRRAKRYNDAIEGMKRVVWPLASFGLLTSLVSWPYNQENKIDPAICVKFQDRIEPDARTIQSFQESLKVMHHIAKILNDYRTPLKHFTEDWKELYSTVVHRSEWIEAEVQQLILFGLHGKDRQGRPTDSLKLLSDYGFASRCLTIWSGLKTVVEKLSPEDIPTSRSSSVSDDTPLPAGEVHFVTE